MYKFLAKNGQTIAFGLGALLIAIFLIQVLTGVEAFEALAKEEKGGTNIFNFGLKGAGWLTFFCALFAVGFGVYQILTNLKGSVKGLVAIAVMVGVFFIAQSMAGSDAAIQDTLDSFKVTPGQSAFISGAITTALALAGLAAATFVLSEIRNFFK